MRMITVITATLNSYPYIRDCVESLKAQITDVEVEHIVVDGGSIDGTLAYLRELDDWSPRIVSEPDRGIYDALNKGIRLAAGDVIGMLNSDDFYATDKVIDDVMKRFETTGCDCLYGNLDFVFADNPGRVLRRWRSSPFVPGSFAKGWHPPHPGFFVRREVYEHYGTFDTSLQVSADFELMLRFLEKYRLDSHFLDKTLVKMRYGGESTGSIGRIIEGNRNIIKAFRKNDLPVSRFYPFIRLLPKLREFLPHR